MHRPNPPVFPAMRRPGLLLAALLPCLAGVGYLYQTIATALDRRSYPAPGILVPMDGHQFHLHAMGNGTPTVVLETGLGGMSSAWGWVQPETAKFARVVAYDRPGLGWSEPDHNPITAVETARRLRRLLDVSGSEPPYVLVGHSMGGLFIRMFAHLYPDEVTGMVLVDAAHPDQLGRTPAITRHMISGFRMLKSIPLLAKFGYVRLTGFFNSWPEGLPPRQKKEARSFLSQYRHLRTTRDESLAWEAVCSEVRSTGSLGDKPLAVVSAGKDQLPGAGELQRELGALSSNSSHVTVDSADHVTLVTHREHALTVVDAIRQVVEQASVRG
jgi:pimeloyl-ACP methyl ester carboxylesterase